MTALSTAHRVLPAAEAGAAPAADTVTLNYDDRLLRRKRLVARGGTTFLVDLPRTAAVAEGDRFVLSDGRQVAVAAADEALLQVMAEPAELPRLAWHVGNRHTPAMFDPTGRLLLRRDPVLARMLEGLGARVTEITGPFAPEGGAYGTGRPMGHDHGHDDAHGHRHGHAHDHVGQDHASDQDHHHDHSRRHENGHDHHQDPSRAD